MMVPDYLIAVAGDERESGTATDVCDRKTGGSATFPLPLAGEG